MKKGFWGKTATWTGVWTIGIGIVATAGFSAMLYDGCNNQQTLHFPVPVSADGSKQTKLIKFGTGALNYGQIDIDKSVDVNKEFPNWPKTSSSYKSWIDSLDETKNQLNKSLTDLDKLPSGPDKEMQSKILTQQINIINEAHKTYTFYVTGAVLTAVFALTIVLGVVLLILNAGNRPYENK